MTIEPAHYKNSPEFIQFAEGAGDYRREADARRQRGLKRAPDLPMWLLETGRRAGLTHAEMRSALGISSNTLSAALRNFGIVLPRSNRERAQIFSAPPIVSTEQPPSAAGMVAAWLSTDVAVLGEDTVEPEKPTPARPAPDTEPKRRLKLAALAEIVAKRLIGETADRLGPGHLHGPGWLPILRLLRGQGARCPPAELCLARQGRRSRGDAENRTRRAIQPRLAPSPDARPTFHKLQRLRVAERKLTSTQGA